MVLKRSTNEMPRFVKEALIDRNLVVAFESRPPYQKNDYLGWISRAKRQATTQKRLAQMLDELEAGNCYMNMTYNPEATRR